MLAFSRSPQVLLTSEPSASPSYLHHISPRGRSHGPPEPFRSASSGALWPQATHCHRMSVSHSQPAAKSEHQAKLPVESGLSSQRKCRRRSGILVLSFLLNSSDFSPFETGNMAVPSWQESLCGVAGFD